MSEPLALPSPSGLVFDKSGWALTGARDREHRILYSLRLSPEDAVEKINLRLQAKYREAEAAEVRFEAYQAQDAEVLLVSFGLASRVCRAAIQSLRAGGVRAGLFRPITLWPFPYQELAAAAAGARRVLVVEMNAGQMLEDVRLALGERLPVEFYGRMGAMIVEEEEIVRRCRQGMSETKLVYSRPQALVDVPNHYCPGCGHGIIHKLLAQVIDELGIRDKTILVAPVGCSVLMYYYLDLDSCEAAHGRAQAVATGLKRVHPDHVVISYQGDGDLLAIGTAETVHAANRGENFTTVFVNNAIYGMTGGQMAPTILVGQKTKTSPYGRNPAEAGLPIRACELLATLEAPVFIERCAVNSVKNVLRTKKAIRKALENQIDGRGYSFVEVLSMCPTNWGMDPVEAAAWVETDMMPFFPLGNFRDR